MDINNVDYIIIKFGDLLTRYTPFSPTIYFIVHRLVTRLLTITLII